MALIYLALANLARRLEEWAMRKADPHDRHICSLIKEQW